MTTQQSTPRINHFTHDGADIVFVDSVADTDTGNKPIRGTLLFVHGMFCNHSDWRNQIDALSTLYRCVAIDLRGHGDSRLIPGVDADPALHANIERMGRDVSALAEALDLTDVTIIGHSMGCRVIVEANRHMRERVVGLVMVDGSRFTDNLQDAQDVAATLDGVDFEPFVNRMFEQMFTDHTDAHDRQEIMQRLADIPSDFGKALFSGMLRWDATRMDAVLGQANQPLLVIQSTRIDENRQRHPLNANSTSPWLDYLTGFTEPERLICLTDTGHFPQVDNHEQFNQLLSDFVNEVIA